MARVNFKKTINLLNKLPKVISRVSKAQVTVTAEALKSELQIGSPVETGLFRSNWWIARGKKSSGTIASLSVQNRMVYGPPIEHGSEKGSAPWPNARNPKTVEVNGRIYSSQAIGGVIVKVSLQRHADELAEKINAGIEANLK